MDAHILSSLIERHGPAVGPSARQFLERVYSRDLTVYETRLRQYGLVGHARVLDAGCGFGQWSLALAQLNTTVRSCDVSEGRVAFLQDAVEQLGVQALEATVAPLDTLPYADAEFDAIYCYGVLFLTPWRESLRELVRVLQPNGRLYVNANGFGWYKHLWFHEHNRGDGYDPKALAARALTNTLAYERANGHVSGTDVIIDPRDLTAALLALGCTDIEQGAEGMLGAPGPRAPFFEGQYLGDLGVYEVLCRKAAVE